MDLEAIKKVWSEMSDQLEKQKKLTNEIILKMTQERYSNKFRNILNIESFGAVICYLGAILLIANFGKLDTWYLVLCGIITLGFMLILPLLVLRSLSQIKNLNITKGTYKDTIVKFERVKKNLLLQQQFGVFGGFMVFFTALAVSAKIMSGEDIFMKQQDLGVYIFTGITIVLLFFFTRWGYNCYKSITTSAENILKELE